MALLKAMTINPAKLFGLPSGTLAKGAPADVILFDPGETWVLNKDTMRSRSKNSPFDEIKLLAAVEEALARRPARSAQ